MAVAADTSFISRRSLVFILIVGLHVVFFWALNSGLSSSVIDVVFGPIETRVIEEKKEEDKAPPPPPPKMETPPPYVPPPDVAIELPVDTSTTAITQVTTQRPPAPPPPAPAAEHKPVVVAPRFDPRRPPPSSEDYYPPAAKRAGEQGTVTVAFYVQEDGKIGDAKVQESSGSPRLDEGALKYVKQWPRMIPATQDGKPIAMWHAMRVTFKLKD